MLVNSGFHREVLVLLVLFTGLRHYLSLISLNELIFVIHCQVFRKKLPLMVQQV